MQFLKRVAGAWFGARPASPDRQPPEQLVFVTVPASAGLDRSITTESPAILELKNRLESAVRAARVERVLAGAGDVAIWIYGANAEEIWTQASRVVRSSPLTPRGYVLIRHGGPGAFERQIEFDHLSASGPTSVGADNAVG